MASLKECPFGSCVRVCYVALRGHCKLASLPPFEYYSIMLLNCYCGLAGKGLKVYGSNPACQILAGALPPELIEVSLGKTPVLELCVVRPGDTLDLGGGEDVGILTTWHGVPWHPAAWQGPDTGRRPSAVHSVDGVLPRNFANHALHHLSSGWSEAAFLAFLA